MGYAAVMPKHSQMRPMRVVKGGLDHVSREEKQPLHVVAVSHAKY